MANLLVIAAHADDEALGCGGLMAKSARRGDQVRAVFMTDGESSRGARPEEARRRREACRAACALLGAPDPVLLDFPDNAMDGVPLLEAAKAVEAQIAAFPPDLVLTHHAHDLNVDHRVVHEAVMTALRPQPGRPSPTILCFETPSSTEWRAPHPAFAFAPNWHEEIAETLAVKMAALEIYAEEMRPWPHARSFQAVEALAKWRGACVGVEAAEAFMLARSLRR